MKGLVVISTSKHTRPTLVTGIHGKTGRRVAERLASMGRSVRSGSRWASPRFDWEDRSTWAACLQGVGSAYVSYQPDLAVPGAVATLNAFFLQAVQSGVERLVFLSGRGEVEAEAAEKALQASGANWTILRSSWFCQNFSEGFLLAPIRAGHVALPAGLVPEPFVDVEDIADVAAAALTEPGHSGRLYELTGPRALTFAQALETIARATKRTIRFVSTSPEDFRARLSGAQVSSVEVDLMLYLFATVLDGRNEDVADGVQRALGRPPRDFADYVQRATAAGAWGA